VESRFGQFGEVLVSVQDQCMVCAKHTVGSEIVLDAPDITPRWTHPMELEGDVGHVESRFGPIWR
jgi:hypothetical protein